MCDSVVYVCCREAVGSYAENQRITAVRRVYQRGTVTPMHSVEQLWKEYCIYENVSISIECLFTTCCLWEVRRGPWQRELMHVR